MAGSDFTDFPEDFEATPKPFYKRLWFQLLAVLFTLCTIAAVGIAIFVGWNYARLPEVTELKNVEFTEPLKIYTRDGQLISEIGEIKRTPVELSSIPLRMKQAFLAAEDARFYDHSGIDYYSLSRAVFEFISSSKKQTGASTITMQLARGFYLTNERSLGRKFREILLAYKIERELSKEQIFELYLNKIFLGHKSYGVAAAALTYYNANLEDLTLAQIASIAALPKAPSTLNPISNSERNIERRNWIIGRMLELEYIDEIAAELAISEPADATPYNVVLDVQAGYVAEAVRQQLLEPGFLSKEGVSTDFLYNNGIRVYTTIDSTLQHAANHSSFAGLMRYEERHGFKGPISHIDLFDDATAANAEDPSPRPTLEQLRQTYPRLDAELQSIQAIESYSQRLTPALVVQVADASADLITTQPAWVKLSFDTQFPFNGAYKSTNKSTPVRNFNQVLRAGDVVYLRQVPTPNTDTQGSQSQSRMWVLAQAPSAQTALVSLDPSDGSVLAMVGGSDFGVSQFNRAMQAERLIGSNIKPLIYAYGFDNGLAPGSVFVDGPFLAENWRPQNAGLSFLGPITLRQALTLSRNLVSVRLLDNLGVGNVGRFIQKLNLANNLPQDLSMALGTASFSPINAARAMSMFTNGGYLVEAQLIETVQDNELNLLYARPSLGVCMNKLIRPYTNATTNEKDIPNQATSSPTQGAALGITADVQLSQTAAGLFDTTWASRYCADNQATPSKPLSTTAAWLTYDIMQDVIRHGTARKARSLKRSDYAGKTGTTNETIDAWFTGLHPMIVTSVWTGFDTPTSLGRSESGSLAALPTWIDYMEQIQGAIPEVRLTRPNNVLSAYIDPVTGQRVNSNFPRAKRELFTKDAMPEYSSKLFLGRDAATDSPSTRVLNRPEDIF